MTHEFAGQQIQKLGVRRRVLGMHFVQRMGQTAPHKQKPDTVHAVTGKKFVVL